MRDINLDGLDNVKADKKLIEKTVNKIMNNSRSKTYFNIKRSLAVVATLMVIVGSTTVYALYNKGDLERETANKIVTDSNVDSNKTAEDDKVTPDKVVEDKKVTPDKAVEDDKVTPGKATEDNKVTLDKAATVENSMAPNKGIVATNVINIPPVTLNTNKGARAKMFALVVYKGKIYTESNTKLDPQNIKNFLGEKIGRTINSIDEWNVKAKSSEELASNIGEQDVYTVKGYDDDFRIMSYSKIESGEYAQFFDCLNGITVKSGKDIFGKLNLVGNIESAKFITFEDWNNGTNNYINFKNVNLLNEVSKDLNNAVPYNYETVEKDIDSSRNKNEFREFTLKLKDNSELKLTAFKKGYVSYGYSNIYFKVESSVIDKLWQ